MLQKKPNLTPRERQVLIRLLCGVRISDIAEEYGISIKTVETHATNINHKFGAHRRGQLLSKMIGEKQIVKIAERYLDE